MKFFRDELAGFIAFLDEKGLLKQHLNFKDTFELIKEFESSEFCSYLSNEAVPTVNFYSATDYDPFRARIMLDTIDPQKLSDSDWLAVMSACKNIGIPYSVVDEFNRRDPKRYNEKENETRWQSLKDPSYDIEVLHGIAKRFGYSEKSARQEWYNLREVAGKIDDTRREQ